MNFRNIYRIRRGGVGRRGGILKCPLFFDYARHFDDKEHQGVAEVFD